METTSLKALAVKVLTGKFEGNSQEIKSFLMGKQNGNRETSQETRARGYGCAKCSENIYDAVEAWIVTETTGDWKYLHAPVKNWKCSGCGETYQFIGGSKGPQPIN